MSADPQDVVAVDPDPGIDERARQILDFEREWWRYAGAKEQAVRERFTLAPTDYYQLLNTVIDDDAALAYDPMLVKRLRRLRSARQRQRAAKRSGADAR
ncbi:DUF3263 domain-containing protein [Egicoccus halophilus]|uniref:DUF3263 domain-containing protein n=1 Tax=Egicoccus halophilus TaxID=1670830 RepID=A0A8J3EUS9_9ACTN|nr:DUF3263 domain-containing protein [Egicoccus halophilus]GGI07810.1 hypothetical protein GCM10011354_25950 [Egicoccus halophilus]